MWSIELISVSIICLCHQAHMAQYQRKLNYQQKAMLDDFKPTHGSLYKGSTRSKVDCSTRCESVTGLRSFFYVQNTHECECYNTSYASTDGLTSVPSAKYYEKQEINPPTTTTTRTTAGLITTPTTITTTSTPTTTSTTATTTATPTTIPTTTTTATTLTPTTSTPPGLNESIPMIAPLSDAQFSASTEHSNGHAAHRARLNDTLCWGPVTSSAQEFLQVDCLEPRVVTSIITRGCGDFDTWVKTYKVSISSDCTTFIYIVDANGIEKIFDGNVDQSSYVENTMSPPVVARCLRIYAVEWEGHISFRIEAMGYFV